MISNRRHIGTCIRQDYGELTECIPWCVGTCRSKRRPETRTPAEVWRLRRSATEAQRAAESLWEPSETAHQQATVMKRIQKCSLQVRIYITLFTQITANSVLRVSSHWA